jgi:KDO2-lipid IV(A) lauroyltransferase
MYYIVFPLLYLLSCLPFFMLYRLSDFAAFVLRKIIKYRKDVVLTNLKHAFPDKSDSELNRIAKDFYRNLTDTFIESIKMISLSKRRFYNMVSINLDDSIALAEKGKSIQFLAGHQFNWELANWIIADKMPIPFVGVYMKIKNKAINKIFYDMRSRTGTKLVATHEFRTKMHQMLTDQHCIGLAADQNPGNPENAYWLNFLNRPAPFVTGPDKSARKTNYAVVFLQLVKIRRGKYDFRSIVVKEDAAGSAEGELTRRYRDLLEETVRSNPDNYLWSHRRWKRNYLPVYRKRWIDTSPSPEEADVH